MEQSFHLDALNQEIERLKRVIEEGERAIIRQLDGINRADKPTSKAKALLLEMIETVSVERERLESLRLSAGIANS
jgi:hypothetical protein